MEEPIETNDLPEAEEEIVRLVEQARRGDEKCFGKIVEVFAQRLQAMIYRMILDWDETRDVAQETFVSAWQALPRYRPEGKFQGWLFRIGARKALDVIRRRKRHPEARVSRSKGEGEVIELKGTHDRKVERNELQKAIEAAVRELAPDQRTAFVLAEYEGYAHAEIGEVMGISSKAVEMHIYRARANLREKLKSLM